MSKLVFIGRLVALFWTLLILACDGNIIDTARNGNPASINWAMAVAVIGTVFLVYQLLGSKLMNADGKTYKLSSFIMDVWNTLAFLVAGIVLAAALGVHSCDNKGYLRSNQVTNGAGNMKARCQLAQATTAFLWFGFATFLSVMILDKVVGGDRKFSPSRV